MEGRYRIVQIGTGLPHLRLPIIHILLRLYKVQYFPLQIGLSLLIPDIDTLHILVPVP